MALTTGEIIGVTLGAVGSMGSAIVASLRAHWRHAHGTSPVAAYNASGVQPESTSGGRNKKKSATPSAGTR